MSFPYMIHSDTETHLSEWVQKKQDDINMLLVEHGVVLLRGFEVVDALEFENAMKWVCPNLLEDNGEHNRDVISNKVYTPTPYSADLKIKWHNENSFHADWPAKLFFACVQPAEEGGETPIVDTKKFFKQMDPQLRKRFIEKKIMYVRNYEVGLGLSWQQTMNVTTEAEAEEFCRKNAIDFEWGDETLRTQTTREAVIKHPVTGIDCWFAQPTHWHPASLEKNVLASLSEIYSEDEFPRNCFYGDGSPIGMSEIQEIEALYQELEVSFQWIAGDVMLLDNIAVAHARNPYKGKRKILICMG